MRRVRDRNVHLVLAMVERRHSNRTLAVATGVGEQTISRAVNKRQEPTPETKSRIARALGKTVRELFPEGGEA